MEKQTPSFISWEKLRDIDLVGFLASLGYEPARIRGQSYWYRSPIRTEKTPSFKVNRRLNRWWDFGSGRGGSIIDFCQECYRSDLQEIVQILSGHISLLPSPITHVTAEELSPIKVTQITPLSSAALTEYLKSRRIPIHIAEGYVKEIRYSLYDRSFFALGFPNDSGGFEIRNQFFKGSSSPKAVTTIANGHDTLSVFEGFFDFLSYLTLRSELSWPETDYLILNSLSLVERSKESIRSYPNVSLYLDHDPVGRKVTQGLLDMGQIIQDRSTLYRGSQDLNEFLVKRQLTLKRPRRIRL